MKIGNENMSAKAYGYAKLNTQVAKQESNGSITRQSANLQKIDSIDISGTKSQSASAHNENNLNAYDRTGKSAEQDDTSQFKPLSSDELAAKLSQFKEKGQFTIGSGRTLDITTVTPTQRVKIAYETSRDFYYTDLDTNKQVYETTFKYRDTYSDSEVPGKFFINGRSFFDEAAKLYESDHEYLDNKNAWLSRDISRYAKDATNFFGGDTNDTETLESQINAYIRALADAKGDKSSLADTVFTVAGTDFKAGEFMNTINALHETLRSVGQNQGNSDEVYAKIENYAKANLNDEQAKLLLGSRESDNWRNYSNWADVFARDEDVFKYM